MYAWVWRHLPGPLPVRLLVVLALCTAVAYGLFMWIFPWADDVLNISDVTVG